MPCSFFWNFSASSLAVQFPVPLPHAQGGLGHVCSADLPTSVSDLFILMAHAVRSTSHVRHRLETLVCLRAGLREKEVATSRTMSFPSVRREAGSPRVW